MPLHARQQRIDALHLLSNYQYQMYCEANESKIKDDESIHPSCFMNRHGLEANLDFFLFNSANETTQGHGSHDVEASII